MHRAVWTGARYRYAAQRVFYLELARQQVSEALPPRFVFVVVKKSAPHVAIAYDLGDKTVGNAEDLVQRDLETW